MTALIVAACIAAGILGIGATWLILAREDARPLSVPGRDAPESPATTGPPVAAPPWWREGEPGIPAGGSSFSSWSDPFVSGYCADGDHGACMPGYPSDCPCDCHGWTDEDYEYEQATRPATDVPPGDTAVPARASLPEGDKQLLWPPQEAPAREPSPLAKAVAAIRAAPVDDYLGEVEDNTAYGDDGSLWNWVSDETRARGIPVFKDEVA